MVAPEAPAGQAPTVDPPDSREERLFRALDVDGCGRIRKSALVGTLSASGVPADDPRLRPTMSALDRHPSEHLDLASFCRLVRPSLLLVEQVLRGDLVIPDFGRFSAQLTEIFEEARALRGGEVATYIPQLARVDPEAHAVSVFTTDGQRFTAGDHALTLCAQSTCKPINYALALEQCGEAEVHRHVGREPSGQRFNELTLNADDRPHNPMINAGAIVCCSLIHRDRPAADRFEGVMNTWERLAGGRKAGFSNAVYQSERRNADRNFALGYFMRENGVFPQGTDLIETLEFYFQCCAIEIGVEHLAAMAATLANGGVVPTTGERVLEPETVRSVLSLMYSCGMYDFSGEFAFSIGLPAKSAVSGAIMTVVPNVLGMCVWSPRLDPLGNSVRGVEVCRRLVDRYNFHNYDNLTGLTEKEDPRRPVAEQARDDRINLIWAAAKGDLRAVQRLVARGVDPDEPDYDGRTALHLAAAEGKAQVVGFLLSCGAELEPRDRWGHTPRADAERAGFAAVARTLEEALHRRDNRVSRRRG
jgi:glutaminase